MLNSITPALSEIVALPNTLFLPLHGRHITQQNVNAVTQGYPTLFTLGTNTSITGQTLKVASANPSTYNGYYKVLWASGSTVAVDFDSTALAAYVGSGVSTFNHVSDATGVNGPYDISGTITNIFSNPTDGITADASGTWIAPSTTDSIFELSGYTGKLLIAFDLNMAVLTSGSEFYLGINKVDATGTNSKYGTLTVGIYGGGQNPSLIYRPATAADGGGTNTTCATLAMAGTTKHCAWIVDFSEAAPVIRSYHDGVAKASATAVMTNATGHPSLVNGGRGILCGVDGSGLVSGKVGSASATPPRIQNLIWQKSDESISTLVNRIRALAALKEYRA